MDVTRRRSACFGLLSSSMLFNALATVLFAIILIAVSVAALACPNAELDDYHRLVRSLHPFCLAADSSNRVRNGLLLLVANGFALAVSSCTFAEACRAYTKFLPEGVTASFARCILREMCGLTGLGWCLKTRMRNEPGPLRVKVVVLLACLATPQLAGLVTILTGVSYTATTVRVVDRQLSTASIPSWMSYNKLKQYGWDSDSPTLQRSQLMANSTATARNYLGSGLPTIKALDEAGHVVQVPFLGMRNILVEPVPKGVTDFVATQEYLLVRKTCVDGSAGVWQDVLGTFTEGAAFWQNLDRTLPEYQMPARLVDGTGLYPDAYNYSSTTPEQAALWWSDTELTVRTLSRELGTACRTHIVPVRFAANIPANLTVPLVLESYQAISFSAVATRWVSTALNLTTAFVKRIDNGEQPVLGGLGQYVKGCFGPAVLAADGAPAATRDDSCVSTEFDKLLMANLLELMSVPPVETTSVVDERKYTTQWGWGPQQARFVPNKPAAAGVLVCTLLVLCLLVLLHAATSPPASGLVVRDVAPWAALADCMDPPAALEGLAGLGIEGLAKGERQRGVVLSMKQTVQGSGPQEVGSAVRRSTFHVGCSQEWMQANDLHGTSKA